MYQEKAAAKAAAARKSKADLWAEERSILERQDSPKAADADRLHELVEQLSLDPREVEVHALAITEAATCRKAATEVERHDRTIAKADKEVERLGAQIDKLRAALTQAADGREQADQAASHARRVAENVDRIEAQFPALFGLDAEPSGENASPTIQALRRKLGLEE